SLQRSLADKLPFHTPVATLQTAKISLSRLESECSCFCRTQHDARLRPALFPTSMSLRSRPLNRCGLDSIRSLRRLLGAARLLSWVRAVFGSNHKLQP